MAERPEIGYVGPRGYRYIGGDPRVPSSWEKANEAPRAAPREPARAEPERPPRSTRFKDAIGSLGDAMFQDAPPRAALESVKIGTETRAEWLQRMRESDALGVHIAPPSVPSTPEAPKVPGPEGGLVDRFGNALLTGMLRFGQANTIGRYENAQRVLGELDAHPERAQQMANTDGAAFGLQFNGDANIDVGEYRRYFENERDEAARTFAERSNRMGDIPRAPARTEFEQAQGFGEALGTIATNPSLIPEYVLESAPTMLPALLGAPAGPLGVAAMAGATSFGIERAGALEQGYMQLAADQGLDLHDPEQLARWIESNPQLSEQARTNANVKSAIIGLIDAATAGVAGKQLVPGALKNFAAQAALQAAGGAGGEALGSLAIGEDISPAGVLAEGLAELGSATIEVPGALSERRAQAQAKRERERMWEDYSAIERRPSADPLVLIARAQSPTMSREQFDTWVDNALSREPETADTGEPMPPPKAPRAEPTIEGDIAEVPARSLRQDPTIETIDVPNAAPPGRIEPTIEPETVFVPNAAPPGEEVRPEADGRRANETPVVTPPPSSAPPTEPATQYIAPPEPPAVAPSAIAPQPQSVTPAVAPPSTPQSQNVTPPPVEPAPAPQAAPAGPAPGRRARVFTPGNASEAIEVEYQVVPAESLRTEVEGVQTRERRTQTAAGQTQIARMAGSLQPELLGASPDTSTGAPIVGADDAVDSGNGRVEAIKRAYSKGLGDAYKQWLEAQGFDTSGIENPVLIRRRTTELTPEERQRFVTNANASAAMRMRAGEQAAAEAPKISDDSLRLYRGGSLSSVDNAPFIQKVLASLPDTERAALMKPDGTLNADGIRRVQDTMTQIAYGDALERQKANAVDVLTEIQQEAGTKSVGNVMVDAAPRVAQLRAAVRQGHLNPEADISGPLVEALMFTRGKTPLQVKQAIEQPADLLGARDPVMEQLVRAMYREDMSRRVGGERLAETIDAYLDEALDRARAAEAPTGDLFGGADRPTIDPVELIRKARGAEQPTAGQQQAGLFDAGTNPGRQDTGDARSAEHVGPSAREGGPEARRPSRDGERPQSTKGQSGTRLADAPLEDRHVSNPLIAGSPPRLKNKGDAVERVAQERADRSRKKRERKADKEQKLQPKRRTRLRASTFDALYRDLIQQRAGETDAAFEKRRDRIVQNFMSMAAPAQLQTMRTVFKTVFGFRDVKVEPDLSPREAMDVLLNIYNNASPMLAITNMPPRMLGLNGNLTLQLYHKVPNNPDSKAFGFVDPSGGLTQTTLGIGRKADSFAHEWFHALDLILMAQGAENSEIRSLLSQTLFMGRQRADGSFELGPDFQEAFGAASKTEGHGKQIHDAFRRLLATVLVKEEAVDEYIERADEVIGARGDYEVAQEELKALKEKEADHLAAIRNKMRKEAMSRPVDVSRYRIERRKAISQAKAQLAALRSTLQKLHPDKLGRAQTEAEKKEFVETKKKLDALKASKDKHEASKEEEVEVRGPAGLEGTLEKGSAEIHRRIAEGKATLEEAIAAAEKEIRAAYAEQLRAATQRSQQALKSLIEADKDLQALLDTHATDMFRASARVQNLWPSAVAPQLRGGQGAYFAHPWEVLARSFEAMMADDIDNFSGTESMVAPREWYDSGPMAIVYPSASDKAAVRAAFNDLFDKLKMWDYDQWRAATKEPGRFDAYWFPGVAERRGMGHATPKNNIPATVSDAYNFDEPSQASAAWVMKWLSEKLRGEFAGLKKLFQLGDVWQSLLGPLRRIERGGRYFVRFRHEAGQKVGGLLGLFSGMRMMTARGQMLALERRAAEAGHTTLASKLRKLMEKFATDPGSGKQQRETMAEEYQRHSQEQFNLLQKIYDQFGIREWSKDKLNQLRQYLTRSTDAEFAGLQRAVRHSEQELAKLRAEPGKVLEELEALNANEPSPENKLRIEQREERLAILQSDEHQRRLADLESILEKQRGELYAMLGYVSSLDTTREMEALRAEFMRTEARAKATTTKLNEAITTLDAAREKVADAVNKTKRVGATAADEAALKAARAERDKAAEVAERHLRQLKEEKRRLEILERQLRGKAQRNPKILSEKGAVTVAEYRRDLYQQLDELQDEYAAGNIPERIYNQRAFDLNAMISGTYAIERRNATRPDLSAVPDDVRKAARSIRDVLDQEFYRNVEVGIDLNYAVNGYLPRVIDDTLVLEDRAGFLQAAKDAYTAEMRHEAKDLERQIKDQGARVEKMRETDEASKLEKQREQATLTGLRIRLANLETEIRTGKDAEAQAEAWLYGMSVNEFFEAQRSTPPHRYTKGRRLPPEADEILKNYYVQDPIELLEGYVAQSARRVAYARRFGPNNELLFEARDELIAEGLRDKVGIDALQLVDEALKTGVGTYVASEPPAFRALFNGIYTLGVVGMLPRTIFNAIAEPLVIGSRTRSVRDAWRTIGYTWAQGFKTKKALEMAELAQLMGTITDAAHDQLVHNRFMVSDLMSRRVQSKARTAYQAFGVTAYTRASRVGVARMGGIFIRKLVQTFTDPKDNKALTRARKELLELGIPESQLADFASYLHGLEGGMTAKEYASHDNNDPYKTMYAAAINRLVDQVIQNPRSVDRPMLVQNPLGKLVFAIMGFNFAFQRNVLIRSAKIVSGEAKDASVADAALVALAFAPPLMNLLVAQAAMQLARDLWDDWDEERALARFDSWLDDIPLFLRNGASRSGYFGAFDPVYQMVSSFKYDANISQTLVGALLGFWSSNLDDIRAGVSRSNELGGLDPDEREGRSTKEVRDGWEAAYRLGASTALPFLLSRANLTGPIGFIFGTKLTSRQWVEGAGGFLGEMTGTVSPETDDDDGGMSELRREQRELLE